MDEHYRVGYCHPPRQHQYKQGQSGNPRGRPPRKRIDIASRFSEPIAFRVNGQERKASPLEAGLLSQVARAATGNMKAARSFLSSCQRAGLFERAVIEDDHQYKLYIPKDWDDDEWMAMFEAHGPPPWPGERNGLVNPK